MEQVRVKGCLILMLLSLILTVADVNGYSHHRHRHRSQLSEATGSSIVREPETGREKYNYITKSEETLDSNGNACLVKLKCQLELLPYDLDIVSIYLFFNQTPTGAADGTLLAQYDVTGNQSKFHDVAHQWNMGVLNSIRLPRPCTGDWECNDSTTYLVSPLLDKDVGEYKCQVNLDDGMGHVVTYLGTTLVNYSSCCPPCSDCSVAYWGVWEGFGPWPYVNNRTSQQRRVSPGCLTNNCTGPRPFQTRRCFEDGTCDVNDDIRISTYEEEFNCFAVIQCGTMAMCDSHIRSVKLYHKRVNQVGKWDLLAQAQHGVSEGRFVRVTDDLNANTANPRPNIPSLCAGLERCYDYFTYDIYPVLEANQGQYVCEITKDLQHGKQHVTSSTATLDCSSNTTDISRLSDEVQCRVLCMFEGIGAVSDPALLHSGCAQACSQPDFCQNILSNERRQSSTATPES